MKRAAIVACMMVVGCLVTLNGAIARECKSDFVIAKGEPAVSRTIGAYPRSLEAWRNAVKAKFGPDFDSWRYAEKGTVDCAEVDTPKGKQWECTRKAIPCKDNLSTALEGTALDKFVCKEKSVSAKGGSNKKEDAAQEAAKKAWLASVKKQHGADFAKWENGRKTDFDCQKGGGKISCAAVAIPCKPK